MIALESHKLVQIAAPSVCFRKMELRAEDSAYSAGAPSVYDAISQRGYYSNSRNKRKWKHDYSRLVGDIRDREPEKALSRRQRRVLRNKAKFIGIEDMGYFTKYSDT